MTRLLLLVAVSTSSLMASRAAAADDARPNILVIMADDLGYADVGFNGSPDIVTPELDKLAKGGVTFSSGYVCHPFCGPSRMGFLSGRYPHDFGAPFNLPESSEGPSDGGIPTSERLMSTALKDAGYSTGLVGKWHLGKAPQYHPNRRGFDDFYGFLGGGHDYFPDQFHAKYDRQVKSGNTKIYDYLEPLEHNGKQVRETEYLTDAFTREACRFIRDAGKKGAPFFLFLSYNAPHTPLEAKESDMAKFPNIKDNARRTYAGMVYAVDRGVGEIVRTLTAEGKLDNTLIVFLSDNGGRLDEGANNAPLREGKGSVYEGGHRTPMLMHWPAKLKAESTYRYTVSSLDLYPTFAGMASIKIPSGQKLDGRDAIESIVSGKPVSTDRLTYIVNHKNGYSDVSARQGDLKAVRVNHRNWQLFDVASDPGETKDLSAQKPDALRNIVDRFRALGQRHVQPLWFNTAASEERWEKDGMPKYEKTFAVE